MQKPKAHIQTVRGDACLTARIDANEFNNEPDWAHTCEICGARPIVPSTGLCGPCSFGDVYTAGGNW
jgi:hypothetical protein